MQQKYKVSNAIAVVGKLAATFALLYLTFRLVDKPLTEWPSLIESMHISLSWLTVALLILLFTVIVNSYKWILLLKCLSPQSALRFERILYYYCAGYFFNSFITGSGDIKRAFDLGRESGQVSQALASVMLDRWSGIVGQLALTFISLQMAAHLIPALKLFNWLCALGIAFLLLAFYVTASLPSHKRPSNRFRLTCWRIQRSLARYKKFPTLLVGCLFLSLISPFLLVVAHFALAKGLNLVVTAPALFYYVPTISVFAQMPITINGFGLQDYCMVTILHDQLNSAQALALSAAFHAARLATGAICGFIYSVSPNLGLSSKTMASPLHECSANSICNEAT